MVRAAEVLRALLGSAPSPELDRSPSALVRSDLSSGWSPAAPRTKLAAVTSRVTMAVAVMVMLLVLLVIVLAPAGEHETCAGRRLGPPSTWCGQ